MALILVVWVIVPAVVVGGWRMILRLEPSNPLSGIFAFLWTFVTIAAGLGLLAGTAFLAYALTYGIPPCGSFG